MRAGIFVQRLIIRVAAVMIVLAPLVTLAVVDGEMQERYADSPDTADFDHSAFDAVLEAFVDDEGFVDYEALAKDRAGLDGYVESLAEAPFAELSRDEKLALLINAYNAFTLQLIIDQGIPDSIRDIEKPWDNFKCVVGGREVSLNDLEHRWIRSDFNEPRIHFVLVCAAFSCPPLRNEAYTGEKLEAQLADQSALCMTGPRWIQDPAAPTVKVTRLFEWYGQDFEKSGGVSAFIAKYNETFEHNLREGEAPTLEYLEYDWSLNGRENRKLLESLEKAE